MSEHRSAEEWIEGLVAKLKASEGRIKELEVSRDAVLKIVHEKSEEWKKLVGRGLSGYNSAGDAETAIEDLLAAAEKEKEDENILGDYFIRWG